MSVSLAAKSIFLSNEDYCRSQDSFNPGPFLLNKRYAYLLRVMFNPFSKTRIHRLNSLRKLGWCLIAFQVLDALLTYHGLYLFGQDAEGNPLVKAMIETFGALAGLSFSKLLTIALILLILTIGYKLKWLQTALRTLLGFYLLFALLPWSYLILQVYY